MEMEWCDNCADALPHANDRVIVGELPCNIASANEGESAVLCVKCHKECIKCK